MLASEVATYLRKYAFPQVVKKRLPFSFRQEQNGVEESSEDSEKTS